MTPPSGTVRLWRAWGVALVLCVSLACTQAADLAQLVQTGSTPQVTQALARTPIQTVDAATQGALLASAISRSRPEVVDALLAWGVHPNLQLRITAHDETVTVTPLVLAVSARAGVPTVAALLRGGASPDAVRDGTVALNLALGLGQFDVATALLDAGASSTLPGGPGTMTALMDLATSPRADEPLALALARRVVSGGVDVNASGPRGTSAIRLAVFGGKAALVAWLAQSGANVNQRDAKGESLLQIATRRGHVDVARVLRQAGATS